MCLPCPAGEYTKNGKTRRVFVKDRSMEAYMACLGHRAAGRQRYTHNYALR